MPKKSDMRKLSLNCNKQIFQQTYWQILAWHAVTQKSTIHTNIHLFCSLLASTCHSISLPARYDGHIKTMSITARVCTYGWGGVVCLVGWVV